MILFFDTSSLVKFFHNEEGTEAVTGLLNFQENEIWVSELARLEFVSALHRRFRNKEIDEKILNEAIEGFEVEIARFNMEPLSHVIVLEAENLLKRYGKEHGLRTLDALHLGCFSLISESYWLFVSTDENLCKVAEHIGAKVINPLRK
ncbi:MAG: type II toxin-antitoxin system VapC family toxin [Deltaproteobacteria bacterium]|nr:type II toxin-antitoxin system VapC family toxin [Deltaproteobacteria bacterium]